MLLQVGLDGRQVGWSIEHLMVQMILYLLGRSTAVDTLLQIAGVWLICNILGDLH